MDSLENRKRELHEMSPAELGRLFPIELVGYNPEWKKVFEDEKEKIELRLAGITTTRISHIGSTAIPGIMAKPTIDILLEINFSKETMMTETLAMDNQLSLIKMGLEAEGYHCLQKPENPPPHMMFVKGYTLAGFSGQAFHLHLRYPGDWDEIRFRDYLLQHSEAAAEYEKLKIRLAEQFRNDRDGYTNAKGGFIASINKMD
ncbi:MAG: GrpB family protein [Bacteroidales bacterium]|nr:GrpB family protein [Bacteroidales bacterium]HNW72082.1 GrpB family protein [Bacteroidales bacterium]HPS49123.1 GrpB family protein [Bacteroidales bacterium]